MVANRALTLLEVLVAVVVVALLCGIALPALAAARRTARKAACTAACRSSALLIQSYCGDWKGYFPCTDARPFRIGPPDGSGWRFMAGGSLQYNPGTWAYLFPDQWSGPVLNAGLRCPLTPPAVAPQPPSDRPPETPPIDWGRITFSLYYLSPVLADGVTRASAPAGSRASDAFHRVDQVAHPSKKFVLFEACVWCEKDATAEKERRATGTTSTLEFAYASADGSCGRCGWSDVAIAHRRQGRDPTGPGSLWITPNGVGGMDLP